MEDSRQMEPEESLNEKSTITLDYCIKDKHSVCAIKCDFVSFWNDFSQTHSEMCLETS